MQKLHKSIVFYDRPRRENKKVYFFVLSEKKKKLEKFLEKFLESVFCWRRDIQHNDTPLKDIWDAGPNAYDQQNYTRDNG